MSIELQAAAGLLTGLFAGVALCLLRPLLFVAVAAIAIYLVATIVLGGPPAIGTVFESIGRSLAAYPVFFSALAVAKAFGCVVALRR